MTIGFDGMRKICARITVVGLVAFGASACSSVPDWVDPTTWIGGSGPSDTEAAPGETPDLAAIPDRPTPTSTAEEQQQVANSLVADRSRAKYSTDALRGGTEPAAAPPPPPSAVAMNDVPAPQPTPPAPAPQAADQSSQQPEAQADTTAQTAPPPPPATATELAPPPAAPQASQEAAAAPPPASPAMVAVVSPSDAALGFKPSSAPPLDPSIAQFVPPPIIARYEQTAQAAGLSTVPAVAVPATQANQASSQSPTASAEGGPEEMSGSVVANLEALQTPAMPQTSVYANAMGVSPVAVILFPGDGTHLNAAGRAQVRAAVAAFKQNGGKGFLRIVGHSSSRTANMPLEKHLEVIFDKSQDRANAVAKEIIRDGIPANQVLVEAVGDSQPVYYESMPKGEDGNRRAEIFLQS